MHKKVSPPSDLSAIRFAPLPLVVTAAELASILRCDQGTIQDNHVSWSRENGFPKPLPGLRPLKWSGPALERWLGAHDSTAVVGAKGPINSTPMDKLLSRYVPQAA